MADKKARTISKREEMAKNGEISSQYTQTSFVKFKPAFDIDRVKVSFVKIGQQGKGFDIYIDLDKFDLLCDDILDKSLMKKLLAETPTPQNKYPYSFRYVTGNNAEKEVKISRGKSADCNIYGKSGKEFMNIPMSYDDLRIMAKWFRRTSAKRFEQLTDMTLKALETQNGYHKISSDDEVSNVVNDVPSESGMAGNMVGSTSGNMPPEPASAVGSGVQGNARAGSVGAGNSGVSGTATTGTESAGNITNSSNNADIITVKTQGVFRKKKNLYVIDAVLNEQIVRLCFNDASIQAMGEDRWARLQTAVTEKSTKLKIHALENNGAYLFTAMAS